MDKKYQPEKMNDFFNKRAGTYEAHMKAELAHFDEFYKKISEPVAATSEKIQILDLGCGTGLEIEYIFKKAPNSFLTGIDMSGEMLKLLKDKYRRTLKQLLLLKGSYDKISFQENTYDYVISVMSLHHLLYTPKLKLYKKIKKALRKNGKYIEGDYVVSRKEEKAGLEKFEKQLKKLRLSKDTDFHIDIPFSVKTQTKLLKQAGFSKVDVIWRKKWAAIIVAY